MLFEKGQVTVIGGEEFGRKLDVFYKATVFRTDGARVFVDFDGFVVDEEKPSKRYFFSAEKMGEWHARYVNMVASGKAVQVLVTHTVDGEEVETIVALVADFAPEVAARRVELQPTTRPPAAAARTRSPGKVAPVYAPRRTL
jgi:hypothetical protein